MSELDVQIPTAFGMFNFSLYKSFVYVCMRAALARYRIQIRLRLCGLIVMGRINDGSD